MLPPIRCTRKKGLGGWNGTKRHLIQIVGVARVMGWGITLNIPKKVTKKARRYIKEHMSAKQWKKFKKVLP